jgi:hypothetical protein
MPTFATPGPIAVSLDLFIADVVVHASARADTVVEVRPKNPQKADDVQAAERTRVEFSSGRLLVKEPMRRNMFGLGVSDAIEVVISLPEGSMIDGAAAVGGFRADGPLADVVYKSGLGDIFIEETAAFNAKTAKGDVFVGRASGAVTISSASGDVRIGAVGGAATIKIGNGSSVIGAVTGDLRISAGNGDVGVERALAGAVIRSACGRIVIDEAAAGPLVLHTAHGRVEVGVPEGAAVWLDATAASGRILNGLTTCDKPLVTAGAVEIRAETGHGDVVIRRPLAAAA